MHIRNNFILLLLIILMTAEVGFIGGQNNDNADNSSEGLAKTDISKSESYSNDRSFSIKQSQENQNKPLSHNYYEENSNSLSTRGTGGDSGQIMTLADASFEIDFNETHSITDTLQGFGNDPWENEPVYLYRTSDLSKDALLVTLTFADLNGSVIYENTTLSQVTDSFGNFTFNLAITSADIGEWLYFVFFNGDGPRGPGLVYSEFLTIKDTTDFTLTVDLTNVGPSQLYTYSVQGTSKATGLGSTLQGLQVSLDEVYIHPSNLNDLTNDILVLNSLGQASKTKNYGSTVSWPALAETDNITVSLSFPASQPSFLNTTLPSTITNPLWITVTEKFTFNVNATIDGVPLEGAPTRYYRQGQNVSFIGLLANQSNVGTALDLENSVSGNETQITITGFTGTIANLFTNTTGYIGFWFLLDTTNFPDLNNITGNTVFSVSIDIIGAAAVSDPVQDFFISINENLDTITASDISPDAFYHPGSPNLVVSGLITDANSKGASNVRVELNINDKVNANDAWGTVTDKQFAIYLSVTNETGYFVFTISDFNFNFTSPQITINITVAVTQTNPDWNTTDISSFTFETSTFNYYNDIITEILVDLKQGAGFESFNSIQDVFNDTFVDYYNDNATYSIRVRDQWGRNATGLTVNVFGPNSNTGWIVSATVANFTFNFQDLIVLNQGLFNNASSSFTFAIQIANGFSYSVSYTYTFILFGPDGFIPGFTDDPSIPSRTVLDAGGDLFIEISIDPTTSAFDNIRFVVLHYRFSESIVVYANNATFSGDYNTIVRNGTSGSGDYNFTIPFTLHGQVVEFYIEVADKAGLGMDGRLVTDTTNAGYAGWDLNFSLNTSSIIQEVLMGDVIVLNQSKVFDYVDAIQVDLKSLDENTNSDPGQNITIYLTIPEDNVLYLNITFSYQVLTFDKNGTLLNNGTFIHTFIQRIDPEWPIVNSLFYTFLFEIDGSNLTYFQQINYNFTIFDWAGNRYVSPQIINAVDNSVFFNTQIVDEDLPENPDPTRDWVTEISEERVNTPTTKQVYNFNETGFVSYNITDTGIGIANITLTMYYYDADGNLLDSVAKLLVENGVILFPGGTDLPIDISNFLLSLNQITNNGTFVNVTESGGEYFMQFYVDFGSLLENMTVSWAINVNDGANPANEIVVNSQLGDPLKFEIINPPAEVIDPLQTVSTIITVDSDGNTITLISTIVSTIGDQEEEDSGNALLVIIVFSLFVFVIALYYQRHNIREYFEKSARKRKARSTLSELIDEIKRLGAEEKYKAAIRLVWEALERLSKEILQVPRAYNQTAREFTSYLSTITIVDRETLLTISNAFEAAKYGKDEPTYDDWDDAVKALDITVNTIIESGARVQIEEDDDEFD